MKLHQHIVATQEAEAIVASATALLKSADEAVIRSEALVVEAEAALAKTYNDGAEYVEKLILAIFSE